MDISVIADYLPHIVTAIIFVFIKMVPNKHVEKFGYRLGVACTLGGNKLMGKGFEKVEEFVIDTVSTFGKGFMKGARSDNK